MKEFPALEQWLYRPQIFDGLWEATPILVADVTSGELIATSPPLNMMFGYDEGELTGQSVDVLVPEAVRTQHAKHRADYANTRRLRRMGTPGMELRGQRKDGTSFPVAIQLSPKTIADRQMVLGIVVDMSGGHA